MSEIKQIDRALKELSRAREWCESYVKCAEEKMRKDAEDRFNQGYCLAAKSIAEAVDYVYDGLKREKERKIADTIQQRSMVAIALSIFAVICCIVLKVRM